MLSLRKDDHEHEARARLLPRSLEFSKRRNEGGLEKTVRCRRSKSLDRFDMLETLVVNYPNDTLPYDV
jgi:hypothetical protein